MKIRIFTVLSSLFRGRGAANDEELRLHVEPVHVDITSGNASGAIAEPAMVVLTGPGGKMALPPSLAEKCAIVLVGEREVDFHVLHAHLNNTDVLSVATRVERSEGYKIRSTIACTVTELRGIYGQEADRVGGAIVTANRAKVLELWDHAAKLGITDIQFSVRGEVAIARFQHEGYMSDVMLEIPASDASAFFTAAFYLADSGDSVEQETEDQMFTVTDPDKLPKNVQTVRGQTAKLADGRHLNFRLLFKTATIAADGLASLGLTDEHLEDLYYAQSAAAGLMTVCGPTESGKSTFLNIFAIDYVRANHGRVTMLGIDDTPEFMAPEILQMWVPQGTGLGGTDPFATKLHTSLRLAPHAIKIGECRTGPVANAAFDTAGTGKFVSTTLHVRETLLIPKRFERIGVPSHIAYDDQDHVCWVALRLVPTLCQECRVSMHEIPKDIDPRRIPLIKRFREALEGTPGKFFFRGDGCPHCRMDGLAKIPGLQGRRLCAEVVRPTAELCQLLAKDYHAARRHLIVDMKKSTIRLHALDHMAAGLIGLEEYSQFIAHPHLLAEDLRYVAERDRHGHTLKVAANG